MNCTEICPKWSQTTNSVQTQSQTSPPFSDALLRALEPGKWLPRRDSPSWFVSRGTVALALQRQKRFCSHGTGGEALRGHSTGETASQSLPWAASGLLRTVVEQENVFKFFWMSLSEGLRSLLPARKVGRNGRTWTQIMSEDKKVLTVMGQKNRWSFEALNIERAEKLKQQRRKEA